MVTFKLKKLILFSHHNSTVHNWEKKLLKIEATLLLSGKMIEKRTFKALLSNRISPWSRLQADAR